MVSLARLARRRLRHRRAGGTDMMGIPTPRRATPSAYLMGGVVVPASVPLPGMAPANPSMGCACSNRILASYLLCYDTVKGSVRLPHEEYRCFEHRLDAIEFGSGWKVENLETYHNFAPFKIVEDTPDEP